MRGCSPLEKNSKFFRSIKTGAYPLSLHPLVCPSQPLPNQTTRTTSTPRFAQFSGPLRTSDLANFSSYLPVRRNCCRRFPVRFLPDVFCALPNPATQKNHIRLIQQAGIKHFLPQPAIMATDKGLEDIPDSKCYTAPLSFFSPRSAAAKQQRSMRPSGSSPALAAGSPGPSAPKQQPPPPLPFPPL